ncbi:MAG TPA: hypothetical protein VF725_00795 [Ktedonobacterales bacterium]
MGNGQNRRRRGGAHGRPGPHRGASANNDRRGSQLVPPTPPSAPLDDAAPEQPASTTEDASMALPGEPEEEMLAAASGPTPDQPDEPEMTPEAPTPPLASDEPAISDEPISAAEVALPEPELDPEPEPEQRAPRGRFERFYAPGQQPRAASNGRAAPPERNGASAGEHVADSGEVKETKESGAGGNGHRRHTPHQPVAPAPRSAEEDEETPIDASPREDVRGVVGGLIDSLHDLFVRDRALASQGGVSRCGICYLHYPLGELVYHEGEGFYVCQPCERALGGARVNMVRRQQRL